MNEAQRKQLREKVLRGDLSLEEQARLEAYVAAHPESATDLKDDLTLNQLLEQLPDAPLSSNFTARVLQAVEREQRATERGLEKMGRWSWLHEVGWARAVTAVSMALAVGLLTTYVYQEHQRAELAQSLTHVTEVTSSTIPSVDILKDFEAINRLSQKADVDYELLAMQ
ncbi:MAG: hypothetical protein AB1705_12550 [Verrucomicrobiota bacterium]